MLIRAIIYQAHTVHQARCGANHFVNNYRAPGNIVVNNALQKLMIHWGRQPLNNCYSNDYKRAKPYAGGGQGTSGVCK